jgi:cell division septal protein FtsQ
MSVSPGTWIRRFGTLLTGVALVILGLVLLFVLGNTVFRIRDIQVVGAGFTVVVDEERFVKNLLFFPSDALRAQLLRDYPILQDVTVKKNFPSTLIVALTPRAAVVRIASGNRVYLVTGDGFVLGDAQGNETLPMGYFSIPSYAPGDQINQNDASAFARFVAAAPKEIEVKEARPLSGTSVRIRLTQLDIYITHDADVGAKASTLQTLLAGFRIKGTLPTVIDLRFDKPIVTF